MPGFGDLVQKAFYLGVGAASYAAEKAGTTLADLRVQAQKLADEMVARGEMTAEDAKRMVDDMVSRAQQADPASPSPGPRRIEILVEDEPAPSNSPAAQSPPESAPESAPTSQSASQPESAPPAATASPSAPASAVDDLRQQVAKLQEELRRLRQD